MIRKILIPLDGSSRAEAALPHAATIARAFEAEVYVLRVIEGPAEQGGGASVVDTLAWRLERGEAGSYVSAVVEELAKAGHEARGEVVSGRPVDQIVQLIRARGIDLVVLATHGTGAATDVELGGTVRKTLERAGVSVMLVPSRVPDERGELRRRYDRILVAVDCSRRSEWALSLASIIARAEAAELVVAHVVAFPEASAGAGGAAAELVAANVAAAQAYLDPLAARFRGSDLRVRSRLTVARSVNDALAAVLADEAPDLTVLCAHGATGDQSRLYGSVAERFLGSSHGVIAVLQDLPRRSRPPAPPLPRTRAAAIPAGL